MSWQDYLKGDTISWLLEPDDPGARYLAMRDILELPVDDVDFVAPQELAHQKGPIAGFLAAMNDAGYWVKAGPGYNPKYRGSVWSIIALAQLGGSAAVDERIRKGCRYLLDHNLTENDQFTYTGAPSGAVDCIHGNLCAAMLDLGIDDPRLEKAFEWMARSVTGEGLASAEDKTAPLRYYAMNCGPGFACGYNNKLPCAWGGMKVMLAFSKLPEERRTPLIRRAIQRGVDFFLGVDPATAGYPHGWSCKPSQNWWKFGFPVFYVSDVLQIVEVLARLGYGNDPRMANALNIVREKQDKDGRWSLEYDYTGKTWVEFGIKKQPNKWVSLRAVRALKLSDSDP